MMDYPINVKILEQIIESEIPYTIDGSAMQVLLTKDVNSIVTDIVSVNDIAEICEAIKAGKPIKIRMEHQIMMVTIAYYSEVAEDGYQSIMLEFFINNSGNLTRVKLDLESIDGDVRLSGKTIVNV